MKYKQRINPIAHIDIDKIHNYIAQHNLKAATVQVDEIYAAMDAHTEFPLAGGELRNKFPIETNYRYAIEWPYILFYSIEGEYVSFYRVLDGRQDYLKILEFTE